MVRTKILLESFTPTIMDLVARGANSLLCNVHIHHTTQHCLHCPEVIQCSNFDLLSLAVRDNNIKLAQHLLEHGSLLFYLIQTQKRKYYQFPLLYAKDRPIAELLIKYRADPKLELTTIGTPLTQATRWECSPKLVEYYLSIGINPNYSLHKTDETALHILCLNNDPKKHKYSFYRKALALIRAGANVNAKTKDGEKPNGMFQKNKRLGKKQLMMSQTSQFRNTSPSRSPSIFTCRPFSTTKTKPRT